MNKDAQIKLQIYGCKWAGLGITNWPTLVLAEPPSKLLRHVTVRAEHGPTEEEQSKPMHASS